MAEIKWIKITTDIFDDEKILLIESMPDADAIIVIWFKLLCFAGKQNNNGVFMMNDRIAYTDKMLATIFRRKESTVTLALETFEQFGMIERVDGTITIPNWDKHQNAGRMAEIREYNRIAQQKSRERRKLLAPVNDMSMTSQKCQTTDIDIDKDIEEDIEKEIYKERDSAASETAATPKVISLPLADKTEYDVLEKDVALWRELYPALDVEQELRNMKGWLDANPKNRKTKNGIKRFINGWLSREQNRAKTAREEGRGNGYDGDHKQNPKRDYDPAIFKSII